MNDFGKILLETISTKSTPDKWNNAIYQPYYKLGNTQKGDSVEKAIEKHLINYGFDVLSSKSRIGDDTTIIGYKGKKFIQSIIIEDKGASEDKNNNFQFNHVRKDKKYNFLLLIGIAPEKIMFRLYSKTDVLIGSAGTLTPMGKDQGGIGNEGTFKITKVEKDLLPIAQFLPELLKRLII